MKLPHRTHVVVSIAKLTEYVLSETHPTGKFKAEFFRNVGFDEDNAARLAKALRKIANSEKVQRVSESVFGSKYIIDGYIEGPNGKKVKVRTVWVIESGQKRPRFVTAYPV